jgi:hypothetical protein
MGEYRGVLIGGAALGIGVALFGSPSEPSDEDKAWSNQPYLESGRLDGVLVVRCMEFSDGSEIRVNQDGSINVVGTADSKARDHMNTDYVAAEPGWRVVGIKKSDFNEEFGFEVIKRRPDGTVDRDHYGVRDFDVHERLGPALAQGPLVDISKDSSFVPRDADRSMGPTL